MPKQQAAPRLSKPRGERTREALLAAGHRLLADRPIDAVAIDDITQEAGVAKGSFYNHFDGKEELASTIRDDLRQQIEAAVAAVNLDVKDPAQRVARALATYMRYLLYSQERANVVLRMASGLASGDNPLNSGVMEDVARGLKEGRFVVPSVEAGALSVIGACQISLMRAVEEPNPKVIIPLAQQLCALLLRGLGVPFSEAEAISAQAMHEVVHRPG
jgi:AcrR family transcriptional regulator